MSSMGFNSMACLQSAGGMNTGSIMPSVTSISSSLSTSPYSSAPPNPATSSSPYAPMYKETSHSYPVMSSSSIASLRLRAKQHHSGFGSYSPPTVQSPPIAAPLSPRSASSASALSACQYTGGLTDRSII